MRRAVPISILLVLVFVASSCAPRQKSTTVGPNVLIVITDDERYGSEEATPRLREWFDEGAIFTRAYATTPHCCPSRVSILTGKYVHNHGVPHPRKIRELDHDTTMQQQLLAAGYATGFIGKYINGWDPFRRPLGIERSTLGVGYERTPFVRDGVAVMAEYGPSFVFREGRTFVNEWEREDEKPWLLTISPFAPHEPFLPEDSYSEVDYPWDGTPATDEEDRTDKPRYVQRNRYTEGFGQSKRESQFRTLRTIDDEFMET
ncbi:MAG: sulfatase-like hydrolase/transferase, partial [Actinomycetota bacterium]